MGTKKASLTYARLPMHRFGEVSLAEGMTAAEREFARGFMRDLSATVPETHTALPLLLIHAEDVVVSYCIVNRLERALLLEGPLPDRTPDAPKAPAVHPALEAASKARERLRKAMKELEDALGQSEGGTAARGIADAVRPLLRQAEGLLDESLEENENRN